MINPLANRLISIRVWLDSWLQMDRIDRELFEQHNRMLIFPNSPIKARNHELLFIFLSNIFGNFFQIGFQIVVAVSAVVLLPQLYSLIVVQNSILLKIALVIESLMMVYTMATLVQCALLLSCSIIGSYLIFNGSIDDLNQKFIDILNKSKYHGHQINVKDSKQLRFYLNEHTRLSYYVIYTDKTTWSDALYYYALISIPMNVALMCELIVEDIIPETKFIIIFITAIHAVTGSFPCILFANMSSNFHAIKDYLPAMQLQLKRSTHLRLKLKYDDLYERLLTGKKIAFTFGYLGDLTFRGLFEALLGYIAAFFLILKIYM
uniref:Uncharacterized protein LOC113790868 n=1 Tax=Dermatophagoides pteronyssinus TaxID=6956 RepID=A0A6P6XTW4_DERPT